jgi:N-methylhydantoinase A
MYSVILEPETPGVPRARRLRREVAERMSAQGDVLFPIDEDAVTGAARELKAEGVEAIAVVFLFSFVNPVHEHRARELILAIDPDMRVSVSSDVDPAIREYERTVATAGMRALSRSWIAISRT